MHPNDPIFKEELPTGLDEPMKEMVTACNGFCYLGPEIEAQIRAVKFLRSRPDIAKALGIG